MKMIPSNSDTTKGNWLDRIYGLILKAAGFLEKFVALILLGTVVYGCVKLGMAAFDVGQGDLPSYMEELLALAFNVIIVIEFIRMLVKHSMNTIVEVLIFAIARGLVVEHEEPLRALLRIAAIAALLACRKFLFCEHDFEDE